MRKLLEAGAHFGHQTRRWNPKMKKYIYGARNGVYIIDLQQTVEAINVAYAKMKEIVSTGGKVLFVGTKKQCREPTMQEALRSGSFYIINRWLGGTLTNFRTIQSRIRYLKELERREEEGEFDLLSKVEAAKLRREKDKLSKNLEGIKEMRRVPNALFVIDPRIEHNAVAEARKLKIPVFGIVDTNSDPDVVDYIIPANDDALRSVSLILAVIADAIVESKSGVPVVAYTKDEGDSVTMKDVIRQTERENAERLARIRAERAARQEAYERAGGRGSYYRGRRSRAYGSFGSNRPAQARGGAAEKAKAEAGKVKTEAEKARAVAEKAKVEAEKAKVEVAKANAEVEKAKMMAEKAKAEVEKAKVMAEKAKAEVEKAKAVAEKAKVETAPANEGENK
ncbi:MAG: 30S ribosomal protein S2 [Erysipelotrichia bacterium]|nr:30S ribosomal protein S2 [Erysipelotrichia bacterium]